MNTETTTHTGVHPDCPLRGVDHDRHYLGRNEAGIPQRCEGDWSEDFNETGWTGR